jgi:hypothetical protein
MGKTVDDWEVGGTLTTTGNTTLSGNCSIGTGGATYLAQYNWLDVDGDGVKVHGIKFWDYAADGYALVYLRAGTLQYDTTL